MQEEPIKVCPDCGSEFQRWIERCVDCGTVLVLDRSGAED